MSGSQTQYPWKLFARIFLIQILAYNSLFFSLGFIWEVWRGSEGISGLYLFGFCYFLGTLVASGLVSHWFSRPVMRIIHKALYLSSKRLAKDLGPIDDNLLSAEIGEFAEIENALNKIERKIRKNRDILVREKEEIHALMGSVEDSLVSFSLDGRLMFFNSHFARLFLKTERAKTPESTYITDLFRSPELFEAFEKVKLQGHPTRITLALEDLKNSFSHFYTVTLTPLRQTDNGEIYGVTAAFHDITEIKAAEQIRIDFVGNASHELRTPITTIKGYVETLREDLKQGSLDDNVGRFLEIISRNADRLAHLVADMLEIHSLENNPELQKEEINPFDVSEQVVGDLSVVAESRGQQIKLSVAQAISIYADRLKLEQVLKNLVGNAIKYSHSGSTIEVSWAEEQEMVSLKVKDNGPGIPESHLARLFERFYRVDRGRARDQGGTGLGLAIVKHIMQTHGGSVTVRSVLGVGSEFTCLFPREKQVLD